MTLYFHIYNFFSLYYNKLLKDLIIIIYLFFVIFINPRKMNARKIYKEKVIEMEEYGQIINYEDKNEEEIQSYERVHP